jgi:phosphatidylglycerol:prolipoprotein diacylglycerol transferase
MHPILYQFELPATLQSFLPHVVTIFTYGFMIAIGTLLAFAHTAFFAKKKYGLPVHKTTDLVLLLIVCAVIGGKFFFFFEEPTKYFQEPALLLKGFENGFVFFGSLLCCIPAMLIYFKKNNLPIWGMLDIMALTTCIVHIFGRMGCFFAGCCYGLPADLPWSITFTHPQSHARPLHTGLHPSQLYAVFSLAIIASILWYLRKRKEFNGQLFLLYLMLYAAVRIVLEVFRGDYQRGFLFNGIITHSQFIGVLIILVTGIVYFRLSNLKKQSKSL